MTKEELWKIFTDKNPCFVESGARFSITADGIRKLFNQTWDAAHEKGFSNGKAWQEMQKAKTDEKRNDLWERMFGRKT